MQPVQQHQSQEAACLPHSTDNGCNQHPVHCIQVLSLCTHGYCTSCRLHDTATHTGLTTNTTSVSFRTACSRPTRPHSCPSTHRYALLLSISRVVVTEPAVECFNTQSSRTTRNIPVHGSTPQLPTPSTFAQYNIKHRALIPADTPSKTNTATSSTWHDNCLQHNCLAS
jgi:hypothetical protein